MTDTNQIIETGDILCPCTGLDLAGFEAVIADKPDISFDEILAITGAASTCTACLLDLEYNFVSIPRQRRRRSGLPGAAKTAKETRSVKRRLFDFLDRISPTVAFPTVDRVSIVRAPGVEQRVWVANRSLLFEEDFCGPPMAVDFTVFGADGIRLHEQEVVIEPETAFSLLASDYLEAPASDTSLTVGSVEIVRRGLKPGYRGTTRPQTEIVAARGACNVHSQAYKVAGEYWFSTEFDPACERIFLAFMNFRTGTLSVEIDYPVGLGHRERHERHYELAIPGNGTALHEVTLTDAEREALGARELALRWRPSGEFNCYAICAAPDLTHFSIDHV